MVDDGRKDLLLPFDFILLDEKEFCSLGVSQWRRGLAPELELEEALQELGLLDRGRVDDLLDR